MTPESYLKGLYGLQGRTAIVIGGTGVLGGAFCEALAGAGRTPSSWAATATRGNDCVQRLTDSGGECRVLRRRLHEPQRPRRAGRPPDPREPAGRRPCQWSRRQLGDAVSRNYRRGMGPHREREPARGAAGLPGLRQIHDSTGNARFDHQHRVAHRASTPLSRVFTYAATKAAVVNLTQNLAREWAPRGHPRECPLARVFSRPSRTSTS